MDPKDRGRAAQTWKEVKRGPYTIQQLPRHAYSQESKYRPWVLLPLDSTWLVLSEILTFTLWVLYVGYEIVFLRAIQSSSSVILWRMWLMVFAEGGLTVADRMSCLDGVFAGVFGDRPLHRPVLRLVGNVAPRVDICVTACGESVRVIIDTVAAAACQDYPPTRYRVFVLDDGQDDALRSMVGALNERLFQSQRQEVVYLRRAKDSGLETFYKAGNIAFGLRGSNALSGAELFAALDADMIPDIDWLRRVVPYLILDDGMAMICPGQVSHCMEHLVGPFLIRLI